MGRKSIIQSFLGKETGGIMILEKLDVRNGRLFVKCMCLHCRSEFEAKFHNVYRGSYKSCGCLQHATQFLNPKWAGHGEISLSYFNSIKRGANTRHLCFEITIDFLWQKFLEQRRRCCYTNRIIQFASRRDESDGTASLDRINPNKGYTENNVQWVHKDINYMKQDMTDDQFLSSVEEIYNHKLK